MGYAEDEESVEAIMQKFQELERMQQELAAQEPCSSTMPDISIESLDKLNTNEPTSDHDVELAKAFPEVRSMM